MARCCGCGSVRILTARHPKDHGTASGRPNWTSSHGCGRERPAASAENQFWAGQPRISQPEVKVKKEDFAAALSPHDLPTSNRPDPHRCGRPRRKLLRCNAICSLSPAPLTSSSAYRFRGLRRQSCSAVVVVVEAKYRHGFGDDGHHVTDPQAAADSGGFHLRRRRR